MRQWIAIAFVLSGCKFGVDSSVKEGEQSAQASPEGRYESVHGEEIPVTRYQDLVLSLGAPVDLPSTTPGLDQTLYALANSTYMQKCEAADVPVPPAWLDPATGDINAAWKLVTTLPQSRIFALSPNLETKLYEYVTDKGTCAALPRGPTGQLATNVVALGMICQGKNGKSCFWDNKEIPVLTRPNGRKYQQAIRDTRRIVPELIADGDNLVENCSNCHRGDNIFIIHEDTDMKKLQGRFPENGQRATPISSQGWTNPAGGKIGAGCGGGCHTSLPALTLDYCSTVLLPSIGVTMPPAPETVDDYKQAIQELRDECARLAQPTAPTPQVNGIFGP